MSILIDLPERLTELGLDIDDVAQKLRNKGDTENYRELTDIYARISELAVAVRAGTEKRRR